MTVVIAAAMLGALRYYEHLEIMSDQRKRVFNALVTGLSIAWGLTISVSFKFNEGDSTNSCLQSALGASMKSFRWFLLARSGYTPHEVPSRDCTQAFPS